MADRPTTITGPTGQPMVWQSDTTNADRFNYLGPNSGFPTLEAAQAADEASGQGSYVPGSFANPNGRLPKSLLAGMILGPAAVQFGGGLLGLGGGGGAAAGGGSAALNAALPGTAVAGFGSGAGTGLGTMGTLAKLGGVGQILSSYAQGAGQGRQAEANLNLNADALRQRQIEDERQNAIARGTLEVTQRKTGQDLENQARGQAFGADLLKAGPYKVVKGENGMWTGVTPTYEHANDIADQAYKAAMQRLLSGSDKQFTPQPNIPSLPLTPQPNESWLDKLARWGGTGLGLAGAIGGYRPPTTGGR